MMNKQGSTTKNIEQEHESSKKTLKRATKNLLVWLDGSINIGSESFQCTMTALQHVVNNIGTFTDSDEFIKFVQSVDHEQIFVIMSGALGRDTVSKIHDIYQINSIFIFCANKKYHEEWVKNWSKIHGVFTALNPLCESIRQAKQQNEQNSISVQFVTTNAIKNIKTLDHLHCSFMYTRILKEILLSIQFASQHFHEFATYCRETFADNNFELKNIEQFEENYHRHTPIWWYTFECFLYPVLNRGLRLMDIDIIIKAGFFINDLHNHIQRLHSEQFNNNNQHRHRTFTVYRGQGLYKTDFDQLKTTLGGLMSFNNFLSTSKNRNVSFGFAVQTLCYPDTIGVLFVMEIDPSVSTAPFASIINVSYHGDTEDEVLFSMHTVFRTHSIQPIDGYDRLFQVNLTLTSDDDNDLRQLTEHIGQEIKGSTGWNRLGALLIKLGQPQKAQELYEIMGDQNIGVRQREQLRGLITSIHKRANNNEIIETNSFEHSSVGRQSLVGSSSEEVKFWINHGTSYYNIEHYDKALSLFEKALRVQQELLPSNHPSIGISYVHIGNVYNKTRQFSKALSYYETALKIQEQSLPPNHPDIGTTFNSIGEVYKQLNEYTNASWFFKRAVDIGQHSIVPNQRDFKKWKENLESVEKNHNMYVII